MQVGHSFASIVHLTPPLCPLHTRPAVAGPECLPELIHLVELPEEVRGMLEIRPVDSIDQVLAAALLEPETARRPARTRSGRATPGARA